MKRILLILCAVLLVAGCAAGKTGGGSLTEGLTPSAGLPASPAGDAAPVNGFSYKLFSEAVKADAVNPVLSPLSAYLCLAMVQNGAAGDTLSEFQALLGLSTDELNALCRALSAALSETAGSTKLAIANSAWADDGVTVSESFLQRIVDHFGAEVFSADLPSDAARKAVNAWVSERTNGLIPSLRDTNYTADTQLVLINTLYLKAEWRSRFMADNTFDEPFTPAGGAALKVPFMHMYEATFDYIRLDGADGVVLPYDDGKTAFIALRPAEGGSARTLAAALTPEALAAALGTAEATFMDLSLPKFTAEFSIELNDPLMALGLREVFGSAADLSALGTGAGGSLYLSLVQQKVKLIVDELGTEAAAVTEAAAAGAAFMPDEPMKLTFDRPFVYAVIDLGSGVPLFMGILDDPTR